MTQMDDELRRALRRVDPPAEFADRVLQRAAAEGAPDRAQASRFTTPLRWAVAAALVAAVGSGVWYRAEERRKQEGEEAKRQVLLSLSIAGGKLRSIEMKVNHEEGR
jgi:hypothetical protein